MIPRSALAGAFLSALIFIPKVWAETAPPRIECVVPADHQPCETDTAVIFHDNFDAGDASLAPYLEPRPGAPSALFSDKEALGGHGKSMECRYPAGKEVHGAGGRKIFFGDSPIGKPLRSKEHFDEIYWRLYVKHCVGWTGDPAKMSRATGFVSDKWNQAFILHVWGGGNDVLTLDPASGVRGDRVVTTTYNDFPNLKWLGNAPRGKFPIHATDQAGRWVCVEAHLKLNAPGKSDGTGELWIDGRVDTARKNMNYRGSYTAHTINAVFLEAYWNDGSPVDQTRWYDDFVVSTKPIGPIAAPASPVLIKTASTDAKSWTAEIARDGDPKQTVWTSKPTPITEPAARLTVDARSGTFTSTAAGQQSLSPGVTYYCRVREQSKAGDWGVWSEWHWPFVVETRPGQ